MINAGLLAINQANHFIPLLLGILIVIVTSIFYKIEVRNYKLVKISEVPLRGFQKDMCEVMNGMNIVEQSDQKSETDGISYRKQFRALFNVSFFGGVALALYGLIMIIGKDIYGK